MAKRKHVPLRTCVSCGLKADKRDLLRVVASSDDGVSIDETGKKNGRGAYVCASCRGTPDKLSRGRLEHSLRIKIGEDEWRSLLSAVSGETAAAE